MRYFIGDTETTGLKNAKAVEIAFMEIDPLTLEPLALWESLIDPEIPIEPEAEAIHGISSALVADEPTIEEFVQHRLGGRIEDECTLIAHNVKFDKPFFAPVLNVVQIFCTLEHSRRVWPSGPVNHKLDTMAEFLGVSLKGTAHRAMGDVVTVHGILKLMLPLMGRTLPDLLQVKAHTIYTMPYGEHKGKALTDLPPSYRTWLLSVDIDENLRRSLMQLRAAGM